MGTRPIYLETICRNMAGRNQKIHRIDQLTPDKIYTIYAPTAAPNERNSAWQWGRYIGPRTFGDHDRAVFQEILRSGPTSKEITSTVERIEGQTYKPVYNGQRPARGGSRRKSRRLRRSRTSRKKHY